MKKFLIAILSCIFAFGCFGAAPAVSAPLGDSAPAFDTGVGANVYLVPGTYMQGGVKVENTVSSGVQKLTPEQCEVIFTENAYLCTLDVGAALPAPASNRVDKAGNPYSFNGWWTIVDAMITYFDTVPDAEETVFLYADWRADLSQRMDPVEPDPEVVVEPNHYMLITRADGGVEEKITLRKSATDVSSALDLGYGSPVQLYAQFTLHPGDRFTVYTTGLSSSEKPVKAPYADKNNPTRHFNLEANGAGTNDTANFLSASGTNYRENPVLTYIAENSGTYNIYIKFFGAGETMNVYMEPPA